jgi:hypothetical protein
MTMTQVMKTVVVKTMSVAQFNWAFKRGMIWEAPDGGFYSSKFEYQWVVPFINRDGDTDGGFYEALDSRLVNV